jgi:hypothetical protein
LIPQRDRAHKRGYVPLHIFNLYVQPEDEIKQREKRKVDGKVNAAADPHKSSGHLGRLGQNGHHADHDPKKGPDRKLALEHPSGAELFPGPQEGECRKENKENLNEGHKEKEVA